MLQLNQLGMQLGQLVFILLSGKLGFVLMVGLIRFIFVLGFFLCHGTSSSIQNLYISRSTSLL
jgi:hypothetical protein